LEGIAELINATMESRGLKQSQVAAYLEVSAAAVHEWRRGTRTPDPPFVWRSAELAHMPVEDAMRLAGHLPPIEDVQDEPELPPWVHIIPELGSVEQEILRRQAEAFAARPLPPGTTLGPAELPGSSE